MSSSHAYYHLSLNERGPIPISAPCGPTTSPPTAGTMAPTYNGTMVGLVTKLNANAVAYATNEIILNC